VYDVYEQITYGNYMNFAYEYFFDSAELEVINRLSTTAYEREFPKVSCACIHFYPVWFEVHEFIYSMHVVVFASDLQQLVMCMSINNA
jgi:hypothetical protein